VIDSVQQRLTSAGFTLPQQPQQQTLLPRDITLIDGPELGRLMGEFAALIAYTQTHVALHEVEAAARKNKHDLARSRAYLLLRASSEKRTEREREALLDTDPQIALLHAALTESEALVTLTKALLNGFTVQYGTLSRELTRRGVNAERGYT
jgi:hypothetical protein